MDFLIEVLKIGGPSAVSVLAIYMISRSFAARINEKDRTHTDGFASQNESYVKSISDIARSFTDVMDRQIVARNAEMNRTLETIQLIQLEMGKKTQVLNKLLEAHEFNSERLMKLEAEIQAQYTEMKSRQSQIDAEIKGQFTQLAMLIAKLKP